MHKIESFVIGSILTIAIPLLFVTFCWFSLLVLCLIGNESVLPDDGSSSDSVIIAVLVSSFILGFAVDVIYIRTRLQKIYHANSILLIALFLVCSLLITGLFMGFPIGNMGLGILAGLYAGRRYHHTGKETQDLLVLIHKLGLFTASIVGLNTFFLGILALFAGEEYLFISLFESLRIGYSRTVGVVLVLVLSSLLMIVQYWLTRGSVILAYGGWTKCQA